MVTVAALMVQPRETDAVDHALLIVGAAVTLIVFHAAPELGRGVLAQSVGQALPIKPQTEAVFPHQPPMTVDGVQMIEKMHGRTSFAA